MRNRAHIALAALAVVAVPAAWIAPGLALGAEAKTTNACYSSFETRNRDLDMTLTGSATAAAAGKLILTAATVSSSLPDFMPVFGYNLGILAVGRNDIAGKVHVAVAGTNTSEAVQVLDADLTATTTVTDPDGTPGTGDETATPVSVTVSLPDSTWTPSGSGPVAFSQAAPGTLPDEDGAGPGGARAKPEGSIFVAATIGPAKLSFDCRPGTTDLADLAHITPSTPAAFATAAGTGSAGQTPATTAAPSSDEKKSGGAPVALLGVVAIAALAGGAVVMSRKRRSA